MDQFTASLGALSGATGEETAAVDKVLDGKGPEDLKAIILAEPDTVQAAFRGLDRMGKFATDIGDGNTAFMIAMAMAVINKAAKENDLTLVGVFNHT